MKKFNYNPYASSKTDTNWADWTYEPPSYSAYVEAKAEIKTEAVSPIKKVIEKIVPDGYVELSSGEIIREDNLSHFAGSWLKSNGLGYYVGASYMPGAHRKTCKKIPVATAPEKITEAIDFLKSKGAVDKDSALCMFEAPDMGVFF